MNAVGESRAGVRTVAWAYDPPAAPGSVVAAPVVTDGEGGVVALEIDGIDTDRTGSIEVTSPSGETVRVPVSAHDQRIELPAYRVGSNTSSPITVTPYSRYDLPAGLGGNAYGAATTISANGIGAPRDPVLSLSAESIGDGTATVTATASATLNGDGSGIRFGIVRDGDRCQTSADGATAVFTGLADGEEYRFVLCAESWFDGESFGQVTTTASVRAVQTGRAPQGWTFTVDGAPNVTDGRAEWLVRAQPVSSERMPNNNHAEFSGWPSTIFDRDPGITVRYVHDRWGTATPWARVVPAAGSAPYQLQATWSVLSCVGGSVLTTRGDSTNTPLGKAAISFADARLAFYDSANAVLPYTAGSWQVPVGAVRVTGIGVAVSWSGQNWGLSDASAALGGSCQPNLPPPAP